MEELVTSQAEGIVVYGLPDAEIAALSNAYLELYIDDLADKKQLETVRTARLDVKNRRVKVDKERKRLKAKSLEWGRTVDGAAKHIFELLAPIEDHLKAEEQKVKDEEDRIAAEEAEKERQMVQGRVKAFAAVGVTNYESDVAQLTDEEYDTALFDATEDFKYEQEAKAEEEAGRKAESERLEKERLAQEEERKRLGAERERMAAEARANQDELDRQQKAIDDQKAKLAAEEQARIEAEEAKARQEREKEEAKAQAAQEEKERKERDAADLKRRERLAPDKKLLELYHDALSDAFAGVKCEVLSEEESGVVLTVIKRDVVNALSNALDIIDDI